MARAYNFSAGPAALPEEVLAQARDEMLDWRGSGMSVMEMSHRGKEFMSIAEEAEADVRELMAHPGQLQGAVPAGRRLEPVRHGADEPARSNTDGRLLQHRRLVEEGHQGGEALRQRRCQAGRGRGQIHHRPGRPMASVSRRMRPMCTTRPNETIDGVEFPYVPETGDVPLVADMSSTILSRPIDVSALRPDLCRGPEEHRAGGSDPGHRARRPDRRARWTVRRPCSAMRPMPKTDRCTTRRPPTAGIWRDWCSSG